MSEDKKEYGVSLAHLGAREAERLFFDYWRWKHDHKITIVEFIDRYALLEAIVEKEGGVDHFLEVKRRFTNKEKDQKAFLEKAKYLGIMINNYLHKIPIVVAWIYNDGVRMIDISEVPIAGTGVIRSSKTGSIDPVFYFDWSYGDELSDEEFREWFLLYD